MPGTRNVINIFIENLENTEPFNKLEYPSMSWKKLMAHAFWTAKSNIYFCYMAESASWQDEANPLFLLASHAGSCKKTFNFIFGHIISPLLNKLVPLRWQDIVLNGFIFVHGLVKVKLCYVFSYYCNFCQTPAKYCRFCKFYSRNLSWTYLSLWQ